MKIVNVQEFLPVSHLSPVQPVGHLHTPSSMHCPLFLQSHTKNIT